MTRHATATRQTRETAITLTLNLDGQGQCEIATGLGFFDHMLECLAKHAGWDLQLKATGDLQVDDHHTVEDCAIVLGKAVGQALDKRQSIQRFGHAYAPLDEALSRAVIDLATRVTAIISLNLNRENIGDVACENISHFFRTLAAEACLTLHLDVLRGENDHHKVESAFKAFALAFRQAAAVTVNGSVSTKGVL